MVEERTPCDVDDVVCQMEVLAHLKGLQKGLGKEQVPPGFDLLCFPRGHCDDNNSRQA